MVGTVRLQMGIVMTRWQRGKVVVMTRWQRGKVVVMTRWQRGKVVVMTRWQRGKVVVMTRWQRGKVVVMTRWQRGKVVVMQCDDKMADFLDCTGASLFKMGDVDTLYNWPPCFWVEGFFC